MSDNVTLTPKVFTRFVLFDMGGGLNVARNMSRSLTPEFANKKLKVGDSVQGYKPYRFAGGDGIGWDPEPIVDQVYTAKVNQIAKVHYQMGSVERTLDVREAMELYTGPVGTALASKINSRSATFAANNALNAVGTPGTAPTTEASYLAAGDILCELGIPDEQADNLMLFINRKMSTAFVSGTKTLFNPTGSISAQWNKGTMQDSLGYKVRRDQTIDVRTNGTFSGSIVVNGANQTATGGNNSTMTLTISGITGTLKQGDRFTIGSSSSATVGGVNSCHPQTRIGTGRQQVFTVQQDSAANPTTVVVAPAITPATLASPGNQYANVDSAPVDQAIITLMGTTGLTNITSGLLMHKNAFGFISVPLWNPDQKGVLAAEVETDPETGLSINMIKYLDGDNREEKTRFDCLWDNCNLYREMASVIYA